MNAILYIGLPGAGKTTHLQKNTPSGYRIVSADEIKYSNKEYSDSAPWLLHEWSVAEAESQMNRLSDEGVNICMDSGGVNNSYSLRIINMLKSKGYFISIVYVDTPVDVCLSRNSSRDRKVPESAIIEKSKKISECVDKQKKLADLFLHVNYEHLA